MIRLSRTCWNWCGSAKTSGRPGGQRFDDGDVRERLLVRAQRQRFADDLVHVDHRARGVALAREGQEVADDLGGALRLAEDGLEAAPGLIVDRTLRQPLGPGEDGRERVVQLVRDAGDRLAERGELLGLQQLVIEVARLVLEPLALADVAHQRLDVDAAVLERLGVRGDLDPDRDAIGAAQPQQVVGDRAVALQPRDEAVARLRIDEAIGLERADLGLGRVRGVAEHQLEVGIGGRRVRVSGPSNGADVDALVDRFEQPRERLDVRRQRARHGAILAPIIERHVRARSPQGPGRRRHRRRHRHRPRDREASRIARRADRDRQPRFRAPRRPAAPRSAKPASTRWPIQLDVRKPEQVDEMVERTVKHFGSLDILVNNAAGNFICRAEELSPNGWNAVIGIVLNGTFYCSRAVGRYMIGAQARRIDRLDSRQLRLDRQPRHDPLGRRQGRRDVDDPDARRRVGAARHPGQRRRPRPDRVAGRREAVVEHPRGRRAHHQHGAACAAGARPRKSPTPWRSSPRRSPGSSPARS